MSHVSGKRKQTNETSDDEDEGELYMFTLLMSMLQTPSIGIVRPSVSRGRGLQKRLLRRWIQNDDEIPGWVFFSFFLFFYGWVFYFCGFFLEVTRLSLEYIYGYRGFDTRDNLCYNSEGCREPFSPNKAFQLVFSKDTLCTMLLELESYLIHEQAPR